MRTEKSTSEKEWFAVFFLQFAYGPVCDFPIAHLLIRYIYRPPVEMRGFRDAVQRPVRRHRVVRFVLFLGWEILLPGWRVGETSVVDFATTNHTVAIGHKVLWQRNSISEYRRLSPGMRIEVNA